MPNCLERHSLCTEANWGLPTQHFQKGIIVWVSIKNIKNKKKKKTSLLNVSCFRTLEVLIEVLVAFLCCHVAFCIFFMGVGAFVIKMSKISSFFVLVSNRGCYMYILPFKSAAEIQNIS